MEAFGAPPEAIDEAVDAERAQTAAFEVYDENQRVVDVFVMLSTQWRVISLPMGGLIYQGLEYRSIDVTLNMLRIPHKERPEVFAGLRVMETAACAVLNRKSDG